MRGELANLNHCAVPFFSRAAINLSWNDDSIYNTYNEVYISVKSKAYNKDSCLSAESAKKFPVRDVPHFGNGEVGGGDRSGKFMLYYVILIYHR